jgi:hypothetical protein
MSIDNSTLLNYLDCDYEDYISDDRLYYSKFRDGDGNANITDDDYQEWEEARRMNEDIDEREFEDTHRPTLDWDRMGGRV